MSNKQCGVPWLNSGQSLKGGISEARAPFGRVAISLHSIRMENITCIRYILPSMRMRR